ncbi:FtsB family cell division protein [Desulfopila aestuarii]|uniref:Cell division protein FtsB n=1 Tax=Desulfopila aestuarii DSM 18488 TaxID=1121416 RepID=A0A1M7YIQ1_9BACT|nr:septum formation initiator family protein [Desulfopila aestuarii]SHO52461.1 cell division protein FtsB [Desulfopila aestuarii DSM 18488]
MAGMRRNTNQKLTPLQQLWLRRAIALLVIFAFAWLFFFPGSGLLAIFSKREEVQALQAETAHLEKDNAKLQEGIDKMKNDPTHLEEVARRDFGLLKPNERVYDFAKPTPDDKKDE